MNKKYYSLEVSSETLKDSLRAYLKQINIYYEVSGGVSGSWYFAILCSPQEDEIINDWLDEH